MTTLKRLFYPVLLLILSPAFSRSQRLIEVSYQKDARSNYQFYCNNRAFCNYVLYINFIVLDNLSSDQALPYRVAIKPGMNKLFKLTKQDINVPERFNYRIGYNKGCIRPTVDPAFTYLLPIGPGKEAQAYELENRGISHSAGKDLKDWYVIRLKMNPGDTIYSARRGTVTEVDDNSILNDEGAASPGAENYVEIVHQDCSFGHYGVLRKNGALVKPGQLVEAGQPIGLVGGDKFGRGADARFSVYYNEPEDSSAAVGNMNVYWTYIPLQFWTRRNGKGKLKHGASYVCERPESVMTQEMNKTEIKKWKASQVPKKK